MGYRRYGHNESDEPRFTQPVMYSAVDAKPSVREIYIKRLIELGNFTQQQADEIEQHRRKVLEEALDATRQTGFVPPSYTMQGLWAGYMGGRDLDCPDVPTGVPLERLKDLLTSAT